MFSQVTLIDTHLALDGQWFYFSASVHSNTEPALQIISVTYANGLRVLKQKLNEEDNFLFFFNC